MVELHWSNKIEPNNRAEIEKHLTPFLWLMPSWCQRLYIHMPDADSDSDDCVAQVQTEFAYRYIRLEIMTCWLNKSDDDKTFFLIHELIHGFVNTSYHQARRTIATLAENNEQLKDFALYELSATNEAAVSDLTKAIHDRLKESMPNTNGHKSVTFASHLGSADSLVMK